MSDRENELEKDPEDRFAGWAILELLGHRRLGGYVTEQTLAGHGVLRLGVPAINGHTETTQFYAPSALYCLTPTTEELARAVAELTRPQPVHRYELPEERVVRARSGDETLCA